MRVAKALALITLFFMLSVSRAQKPTTDDLAQGSNFLIDSSKPFVYLDIEHIGPRKPLRDGEPGVGLWLRLKNNCRLPIVVVGIGKPAESPKDAITLLDEIVPDPQVSAEDRGEDARGGGVFAPPGLHDMMDIFRFPNLTEEEVRSAEEIASSSSKVIKRPRGYGARNGFDSFRLVLVPPGDEVYFSVPANHVSKYWHLEIPFRLAVVNTSAIRPPYSYLALYQEDVDRAQGKVPAATTH